MTAPQWPIRTVMVKHVGPLKPAGHVALFAEPLATKSTFGVWVLVTGGTPGNFYGAKFPLI